MFTYVNAQEENDILRIKSMCVRVCICVILSECDQLIDVVTITFSKENHVATNQRQLLSEGSYCEIYIDS